MASIMSKKSWPKFLSGVLLRYSSNWLTDRSRIRTMTLSVVTPFCKKMLSVTLPSLNESSDCSNDTWATVHEK